MGDHGKSNPEGCHCIALRLCTLPCTLIPYTAEDIGTTKRPRPSLAAICLQRRQILGDVISAALPKYCATAAGGDSRLCPKVPPRVRRSRGYVILFAAVPLPLRPDTLVPNHSCGTLAQTAASMVETSTESSICLPPDLTCFLRLMHSLSRTQAAARVAAINVGALLPCI